MESAGETEGQPADRRRTNRWALVAIVLIKLVHSGIFVVNSAAILHLLVAGIRGQPTQWTRRALVAVGIELVALATNQGRCPLTGLVERLGAEHGRVSDIFLPRWFADRLPWIYTPPLVVGMTGLLLRRRR